MTRGSILAHVLDASSGQPPGDGGRAGEVRACWLLGNHRTPVQDLSFLTGQLTEMAVRALSPGVNDPKTAVECAHRLGAVVAQLGDREMPSGLRYDPEGKLRVVSEPTRFGEVTGSCFDPIRRYGAHDPQVTCALLGAIAAGAAACSEAERLDVLAEHAREVYDAFGDSEAVRSKRDRAFVDEALAHVNAVLEARRDRSAQRGNS